MKHIILTFIFSCLMASPMAMAEGGQGVPEQEKPTSDKKQEDNVEEQGSESEMYGAPLLNAPLAEPQKSWTPAGNAQRVEPAIPGKKDEGAKKDSPYSNYNFLFQLFYKYSLSDFFELPNFKDSKKNSWQSWEVDLNEYRELAFTKATSWADRLLRQLGQ